MSSDDEILRAKYLGTREYLEKNLLNNGWRHVQEKLESLEKYNELGPYWLDLLRGKYKWAEIKPLSDYKEEDSGTLFYLAMKRGSDTAATFIFELLKRHGELTIDEFKNLLVMNMKENRHYHTPRMMLDHLGQDDLRSISKRLLQYAHANGSTDLVALIEERIDYQSPYKAQSLLPSAQPPLIKDIEFTDVKQAIAHVMESGRSSDALQIGRKILNACSRFFEQVQKSGHQGLTQGLNASAQMQQLADNAVRIQASLEKIRGNAEEFAPANDWSGKFVQLFRQWGLARDPQAVLTSDFNSASQMIEKSLQTSEKIMRGYEDFQQYAPQIHSQLEELGTELSIAVERLETELAGTDPATPEAQNKQRLKEVFQSIQYNAGVTKGFVAINAKTCSIMLDTEAKFASSVMGVQSAINAISTTTIMTVAELKHSAIQGLDDEVLNIIEEQIVKASESLGRLSSIAQTRNADLGQLAQTRQKELALQVA